jgi:AraC-like DNA-binding protein
VSEPSEAKDEQVLQRRGQGQAFARISREMGFERAAEAQHAFRRAVGRLPEDQANRVRREELSRLSRLAERVQRDPALSETDRDRQMRTVERMRQEMGASHPPA